MISHAVKPAAPLLKSPGTAAEAITGRPYLSWSQVSSMRSCPRRFAFHYIEKAEPEFTASSLLFGSAIHSAIQLYLQLRMEGVDAGHAELHTAYRQAWAGSQKAETAPVRFNKGEDADTLDDLANRMLAAFLASDLSRPAGTIIAIEESMQARLAADLPDVLARVDVVWQGEGTLHVVDYKTSRSKWNEQKIAESAEQLLLYRFVTQAMSRDVGLPVRLHFGVITKAKAPAVQQLEVPVNPQQMTGLVATVRNVWSAIEAGNFYPSPSPMNCVPCAFKSRCPAFAGR